MLSILIARYKKWFTKPFSYKAEITLVLTCKFLLLYGLWALCFSFPAAMPVDSDRVAHALLEKSNYATQP
jgi:hypothetical protein